MDTIIKDWGGNWGRAYPNAALTKRIAMAVALSSMAVTSCATPAASDGYAANKHGDKARERDKEIRKLEKERDDLAFEGITTQAQVMRKALIEKRLYDLYNRKLGRKR